MIFVKANSCQLARLAMEEGIWKERERERGRKKEEEEEELLLKERKN